MAPQHQLLLGGGTWVAKYGVPSAVLPDGWRLSAPIIARSGWGAATVTTHAVLGMLILGGGVALAIAAAGPAGSVGEANSPLIARGSFRRHTGVPA